mmetsp:Transcript_2733/g.6365  ORF Transcript_2733/g.6365 Transcript_2733/m.6365 type:complete len:131 (+) Transcript_2733:410-802(+)
MRPQPNPTLAPEPEPKPTPSPVASNCPGEAEFVFSLTTDEFPKETKWILKRNRKTIRKRRYKTYKQPFTTYEESICIPLSGKYQFRIGDRFGDGVCCEKGTGSYKISVDGVVKKTGGDFEIKETTTWFNE